MNITHKIGMGLATGMLLTGVMSIAAFANTDVVVSGNGADSSNRVSVTNSKSSTVSQSNDTTITNVVSSVASTGGNSTNKNTGGDTSIMTGDASSTVDVTNHGSTNTATVNPCGCAGGLDTVTVTGNGADSRNRVRIRNSNSSSVTQSNLTDITNVIDSKAKTGRNRANKNTGGTTSVDTGMADSMVTVHNYGSSNTL